MQASQLHILHQINLEDIHKLTNSGQDQINLINWLQKTNALPSSPPCIHCGNPMRLTKDKGSIDGYKWYCSAPERKSKKAKSVCTYTRRLRRGTFFFRAKLTLKEIVAFVNLWMDNCELQLIEKQIRIAHKTAVDWANFCREVVFDAVITRSEQIGGIDEEGNPKTVEIDESKFGRRKYYRSHRVEGQWVFDGIERESGRLFMVAVEKRDATTLIPITEHWIAKGSRICTDYWKAYDLLSPGDYEHLKVNHSVSFVDAETGVHTNTIESSWWHAKRILPAYHRHKEFFPGYLAKDMFMKQIRYQGADPTIAFFKAVGQIDYEKKEMVPNREEVAEDEAGDETAADPEDYDLADYIS